MSHRRLVELPPYPACFVCGGGGLKLNFKGSDGYAEAEFVTPSGFEGYHGFLHGGMTATLLDEVMVKAISTLGEEVVTARLAIRYRLSIKNRERLKLKGEVVDRRGKLILAKGEVIVEGRGIVAQAEGKYISIKRRN